MARIVTSNSVRPLRPILKIAYLIEAPVLTSVTRTSYVVDKKMLSPEIRDVRVASLDSPTYLHH